MDTREKAIELVNKFKNHVNPYIGSGMLSNTYDNEAIVWQAKICATILADEVLELTSEMDDDNAVWDNVKTQISKIETKDIFNIKDTPELFK